MLESFQLILTTCPDKQSAKTIARTLVGKKLAACVKLIPDVQSVYYWQEEIIEENELQLMILTRDTRFDDIKATLKDIHPYEVPEIVSISIHHGSKEYLHWIKEYVNA